MALFIFRYVLSELREMRDATPPRKKLRRLKQGNARHELRVPKDNKDKSGRKAA